MSIFLKPHVIYILMSNGTISVELSNFCEGQGVRKGIMAESNLIHTTIEIVNKHLKRSYMFLSIRKL